MGARTDAARTQVLTARQGLEDEVVRLEAAGRAAIDIPARIRREPVKMATAAGGAAFLLFGGPRRVLRGMRRAVFGPGSDLPKSMLPKEVEAVLRKLGSDGDAVRGVLEREFAAFLDERAPVRRDANIVGLAGSLIGNVLRPASVRAGREFAERLFDPDGPSFAEGLRKARARMNATKGEAGPGA